MPFPSHKKMSSKYFLLPGCLEYGRERCVDSYNAVVQCNDDKCLEVMCTGFQEHAIFCLG